MGREFRFCKMEKFRNIAKLKILMIAELYTLRWLWWQLLDYGYFTTIKSKRKYFNIYYAFHFWDEKTKAIIISKKCKMQLNLFTFFSSVSIQLCVVPSVVFFEGATPYPVFLSIFYFAAHLGLKLIPKVAWLVDLKHFNIKQTITENEAGIHVICCSLPRTSTCY